MVGVLRERNVRKVRHLGRFCVVQEQAFGPIILIGWLVAAIYGWLLPSMLLRWTAQQCGEQKRRVVRITPMHHGMRMT